MKWQRHKVDCRVVYRSECGKYTIEKFDSVMRGSAVWWIVSGAIQAQRKTLRVAKRVAELHAKTCAS